MKIEPRLLMSLALCILALLSPAAVAAQDVRVQAARDPHYVGEGFQVQVIATDFEKTPQPEISIGAQDGVVVRLVGVSPSSSTSISFVNGKMSRIDEVTFVYQFELTGTREGSARVPAFTVTQAGLSRSTREFTVEVRGVPSTDSVSIELELPDGPIFVGQKIRIAVEFRIDRETQRNLISYQLHVPLFDVPTLRFLDEPPVRTDTHLEVQTAAGVLSLPGVSSERRIQGRDTLVVRTERTMIALAPAEIRAEAPKAFISQGTAYTRDIFNQRRATATEKSMATGLPVRIEVAEVPRTGRPESFAGAVGEGFGLEVEADRSVVQLGEPILLTFDLRGDGDLSTASLPRLGAAGLFDPTKFRIPDDAPAGIVDENGKHFEVTLRVLDADVHEIPSLAYSWFDAGTRRFETTYSRPIALSVAAAEIVGAEAVSRNERLDSTLDAESNDGVKAAAGAGEGTVRSSNLTLTGANLAVDRELTRLLRDDRAGGQLRAITLPLYAGGLACLAVGMVLSRRRSIDPRVVARTVALKRAERATIEAFARSDAGGAAALGRSLRELLAAMPDEVDGELDGLIAECDALRFAPGGTSESDVGDAAGDGSKSLKERALRWIATRRKRERRSGGPT